MPEDLSGLTILGQKISTPEKRLEAFKTPEWVQEVVFETDEVTALCPKTGQPDWYHLNITYIPNQKCIESKSLKLYLWTFRNEGHFCEHLSGIILTDVFEAAEPRYCKVTLKMKARGGITIESTAERYQDSL